MIPNRNKAKGQHQLGHSVTLMQVEYYQVGASDAIALFVSRRAIPIGLKHFGCLILLGGGCFQGHSAGKRFCFKDYGSAL